MAPEETSTTWVPPRVRAASASARAAIRSSSIPPRAVVSDEEPTLTTTGLAFAIPGHSPSVESTRGTPPSVLTPVPHHTTQPTSAPADALLIRDQTYRCRC